LSVSGTIFRNNDIYDIKSYHIWVRKVKLCYLLLNPNSNVMKILKKHLVREMICGLL
jgi:hypothetical protein